VEVLRAILEGFMTAAALPAAPRCCSPGYQPIRRYTRKFP
jgi:hypothetical protein